MSAVVALFLGLALARPHPVQEPPPEPAPAQESDAQEDPTPPAEEGAGEPPEPARQEGQGAGQETPPAPAPGEAPPAEGAGQDPPVPGKPATAPGADPEGPATPVRTAVTWPLDVVALATQLEQLVAAHPQLCSLQVIGKSRGGRDILVLTLSDSQRGAAEGKPALLVVDQHSAASCGAEGALQLGWTLAERFAADERVHELLGRTRLVIAPALDPDVRVASPSNGGGPAGSRPVLFERNFPSGWKPDTLRPGSGRMPLSEPETLAAARFLLGLRQAGLVIGFTPALPSGEPYPGADLPEEDRAVFQRLLAALALEGSPPVVPWQELGSPGGALLDYAYQARGIYPLALQLPAEQELAAGAFPAWSGQLVERVLLALALLPRVEITQEGLERLAADTWQLDLRLENVGLVPTLSTLARRREPGADVALELEGAKLVATARRLTSGSLYQDASFHLAEERSPLSGGTLAGGEGRGLRLILEAASGASVEVQAGSPWAGSSALRVALP